MNSKTSLEQPAEIINYPCYIRLKLYGNNIYGEVTGIVSAGEQLDTGLYVEDPMYSVKLDTLKDHDGKNRIAHICLSHIDVIFDSKEALVLDKLGQKW